MSTATKSTRVDVYTRVTESIIAELEKGIAPGSSPGMPNTLPDGSPGRYATTARPIRASMLFACG